MVTRSNAARRVEPDHILGQNADRGRDDDRPRRDLARTGLDPHTPRQGLDIGDGRGQPERQPLSRSGNKMTKALAAEPVAAAFPCGHVPQRRVWQIPADRQGEHHGSPNRVLKKSALGPV
jgi:hypothetical protein